jgi:hypothetical protein
MKNTPCRRFYQAGGRRSQRFYESPAYRSGDAFHRPGAGFPGLLGVTIRLFSGFKYK